MAETKKDKFDPEKNSFDPEKNDPPKTSEEKEITLPHTLKLKVPFDFGDTEYTELVFKNRLTFAMTEHMPMDGEDLQRGHLIPIIRGMTELPTEAVRLMDARDLGQVMRVVNHFLS